MTKRTQKAAIRALLPQLSLRGRFVVNHILKHGIVTTEDLENAGYKHPPRAARDVREAGIQLVTTRVPASDGRSIGAYRFMTEVEVRQMRFRGRRSFPKAFKELLYEQSEGKCAVCNGAFEARELQIDHRVPYEVAGDDVDNLRPAEFQLLCASDNRAKSWSCEHCENWLNAKLPAVCQACYWGNPLNYSHIALREIRRVDIQWSDKEIEAYERLKLRAEGANTRLPEYVKRVIKKHLKQ